MPQSASTDLVEPLAYSMRPPDTNTTVNMSAIDPPTRLDSSRTALWLGAIVVLGLVALGAWIRMTAALGDPAFDALHPEGMLKSDPALLYYFVERILAAGGGIPADFGADPRILYPSTVDVPALFPLGLEFVVAWCYRLFGGATPLHVFCLEVMAVTASATVIGAYGLALELTRKVSWAVLAAIVFTFTWANYRTVGLILVGEDFSLPWFALHLYLLARAVRVRSALSMVVCAVALVLALATWHATSFFVTIEAAVVFAWFVRTGANPLAARGAWIAILVVLAGCCVVPILWSTRAWCSVPMQLALGLAVAGLVRRAKPTHARVVLVAAGTAASIFLVAFVTSRAIGGGLGQYSHVFGLAWEKARHLGRIPEDPRELPAEVRLMWQGPFNTAELGTMAVQLGLAALALPMLIVRCIREWRHPAGDAREVITYSALIVSLPIAWLIERTMILPGVLLPVALVSVVRDGRWLSSFAWMARRLPLGLARLGKWAELAQHAVPASPARDRIRVWVPRSFVGVIAALQCGNTIDHVRWFYSTWYQPPQRQAEIRALVTALPKLVPEGEAVGADFMNSTAILAHTGRPMLLQPKYEDRESRERAIEYFHTFYHGTPESFRRLLIDKYRCHYVVFDRFTMGILNASLYLGGVSLADAPTPGTPWEVFTSQNSERLDHVPGYHLLYRSPADIRMPSGRSADFFRLYRLEP